MMPIAHSPPATRLPINIRRKLMACTGTCAGLGQNRAALLSEQSDRPLPRRGPSWTVCPSPPACTH